MSEQAQNRLLAAETKVETFKFETIIWHPSWN